MATATSYFDRPTPSSIRPGLSHLQASPSSPHTPTQQRTVSSTLNSPSLSYRTEEDALIFEFGARHLSAGFTGECCPRCRLGFGPEGSRRVGDYRRWLLGHNERKRKRTGLDAWGDDHELWRMDLRECDLGLVEDKIERAVREAYTKHLLVDSKSRRLMVVVPSVMPHQILSTLLSTLFSNFAMSSITLLSPPILSTVAAGCRTSLVIDIGWRETVMTGVYEYREVSQARTTRAMRLVTMEMGEVLDRYDGQLRKGKAPDKTMEEEEKPTLSVDVEQAEEVTTRMAWCPPQQLQLKPPLIKLSTPPPTSPSSPISETPTPSTPTTSDNPDPLISIPSPSCLRQPLQIPFSQFALPVELGLLANSPHVQYPDDNELPLPLLIYRSLLNLPPDVRSLCMSRIIFTGGGSNIPGLKTRLLDEVAKIVESRGWERVVGKAVDASRREPRRDRQNQAQMVQSDNSTTPTQEKPAPIPAYRQPQTTDDITTALHRDKTKDDKPCVSGIIRGIETLGAWAGASLLAELRIKGIVDIDKDSFLQHGMAGAKKPAEIGVAPKQRMSFPRGGSVGGGENRPWTLGTWA